MCLVYKDFTVSTNSLGDPTLDSNFLTFGTGKIASFTTNASTDASRAAGTYTVTGLSSGNGVDAQFSVYVSDSGVTDVDIINRGTTYAASETIELLDQNMGGGGAADITVTVSTVS